MVIDHPEDFYFAQINPDTLKNNRSGKHHVLSSMMRKLRGGFYCFQEHGLRYTWNRMLEHLLKKRSTDDYAYYSSLQPKAYRQELGQWYKKMTGRDLDLDHPQTYNEKIQWSKLYDQNPLRTELSDKYLVRGWIREKIGDEYLIPLLGVWDNFNKITFDDLPDKFVLESNPWLRDEYHR